LKRGSDERKLHTREKGGELKFIMNQKTGGGSLKVSWGDSERRNVGKALNSKYIAKGGGGPQKQTETGWQERGFGAGSELKDTSERFPEGRWWDGFESYWK